MRLWFALLLGCVVVLRGGPSTAAEGEAKAAPAPAKESADCAVEWETLCPDAVGPRARSKCLRAHRGEFTKSCFERFRLETLAMRANRLARRACEEETALHCAETPAEGGRVVQCLRDHVSEASPGCAAALQTVPVAIGAEAGTP